MHKLITNVEEIATVRKSYHHSTKRMDHHIYYLQQYLIKVKLTLKSFNNTQQSIIRKIKEHISIEIEKENISTITNCL